MKNETLNILIVLLKLLNQKRKIKKEIFEDTIYLSKLGMNLYEKNLN